MRLFSDFPGILGATNFPTHTTISTLSRPANRKAFKKVKIKYINTRSNYACFPFLGLFLIFPHYPTIAKETGDFTV